MIAGILAHEMGHLACHHPLHNALWDTLDWGFKAGLVATEFGGGGWTAALRGNAQALTYLSGVGTAAFSGASEWAYAHAGWSRAQETKADLIGTEMLIRARESPEGLLAAVSRALDTRSSVSSGGRTESAFSGGDHPESHVRFSAIADYINRVHDDYHAPPTNDDARLAWQQQVHNLGPGLEYILKAQQALGAPLALVGHPEYTHYPDRNDAALQFIRLAFSAPSWRPEQDLPPQADPEMAALADLTATKIAIAELRLRLTPTVFDEDEMRQRIFARQDMPEHYVILNALGYMNSKQWADSLDVLMKVDKYLGRTRKNDIIGMAAASASGDVPSQNMFTIDCTMTADQAFASQCEDARKNSTQVIDEWWTEARTVLPVPPLPVTLASAARNTLRPPRGRHGSHTEVRQQAMPAPLSPAELSVESIARKAPITDDDIRKAWLQK
jgi:hypothetical protein